jgi:TATA-box binding protein (TBP) (component of TFIID and TFIIIB)
MEKLKEKKLPPNEMRFNDMTGIVSINLKENENFNQFASQLANYNPDRFEAVALKFYVENKPVVTIYAYDKLWDETHSNLNNKMPVHKFKVELGLQEFFALFSKCNFIVTKGDFDIEDMEVINK